MKEPDKPVFVARPVLPELHAVMPFLKGIWSNRILTNRGPYHQQFKSDLARFLGVDNVILCTNATLGLIVCLQGYKLTGEVITTPFSFAATVHAIYWNRLTPVFCDIDENTLNLDAKKIEPLITSDTSAILPVHVYGNPCDFNTIKEISECYRLKVIYDAAHAFNVKISGTTILEYGDASVLSFHATKLFHTFEGGAVIVKDKHVGATIEKLTNFGIIDEETIILPGLNAKMSEFQATIGILGLSGVREEIERRKKVALRYADNLVDTPGISLVLQTMNTEPNYSYFPILIDEKRYGCSRDRVHIELKKHNIFSRKYFYPLISNFPCYRSLPTASAEHLPVANRISRQILCLPIYGDLDLDIVDRICEIINKLKRP